MEEPLGFAVGNSLEVVEAIEVLQGGGPEDLREICLDLAARMLVVGGGAADVSRARALAEHGLQGTMSPAWMKFREFVVAQGGDLEAFRQRVEARQCLEPIYYRSPNRGKVTRLDALGIGQAAMQLGAGRAGLSGGGCDGIDPDGIDPDAGIRLCKKCGDFVEEGEPLVALYTSLSAENHSRRVERAWESLVCSVECRE